jgi:acetate kinase
MTSRASDWIHIPVRGESMKVLVLNSGSSSVKFQIIETDLERMNAHRDLTLAVGLVEKIGLSDSRLLLEVPDRKPFQDYREILEHRTAIEWVLRILVDPEHGILESVEEIGAVGHRVVHGGEAFASSVLITPEVVENIEACSVLAPLHNPPNLRGYHAAHAAMPDIPHIAVFDTAFHQTMPAHAFLYGIPFQLYKKHHLRKYGFHGTSHRFVTFRGCQILNWQREEKKLISVHLGNGCSLAAVDHAKSIDTSMGFTPLEGLIMGTRSGDMDPAIVPWLMAMEELTLHQVNTMLNKHSGLYGVSGVSSDMREIIDARSRGRVRADVAFRMFSYRIKKYIAAYAAAMGGVDAVFFTGGIGQGSPEVREAALEGLEFMGVELDRDRNAAATGDEAEITTDASRVRVLVVPTNEEKTIARDVIRVLNGIMPEFTPPETIA